jgi:acetylglutamate kinase
MKKIIDKAAVLIEALPYFQRFRGEMVVVKFGGSSMEDPELIRSTMRDIVFMECVGMKPIVVHGGGKAITAKLKEYDIETRFIDGLRYTCEKTLEVVDDVLHNEVNTTLLDGVRNAGGEARRISGKDILDAEREFSKCKITGDVVDIGFVGKIKTVDIGPIHEVIRNGSVPIIAPLGADDSGQVYNINADVAAAKIAEALKARKLVFLSDVPGILRDPKDESTLISTIRLDEIDGLVRAGVISGGMLPKIESAVAALKAGTNKIHLIDGRIRHSLLLEIFTDSGVGTQIVKS